MAERRKTKSAGDSRCNEAQLAERLSGAAGVLAFRCLADGGMVVVDGRGQKRVYSLQEVQACAREGDHDAGQ
jgi:hypothetical protein